ncbi:Uu.00g044430.m01.CDS01 [Anthostomella pinea]|uniref:Uu.00g044430.m01.CDS01 n=1 Tax=Anthostomella pinea TaxID=933095 RepID=A0AAI8VAZ2_9PEZI|nr:Uu.00g044430.m01.CDS01 [Anthostomella pinea]
MSKGGDNAVVQDTAEPLGHIRDQNATSQKDGNIVSAVLDIQRHAGTVTRDNWIRSLECLYLAAEDDDREPSGKRRRVAPGARIASCGPELLRRTYLDPVSDPDAGRDYVAVSYTWASSEEEDDEGEDTAIGSYRIESPNTGEADLPSNVRDVVWKRVLSFAAHVKCKYIWVDAECVDQEDESEKETAIQNMHLVYSLSKKPVALLTRAIESAEELDLLVSLLLGDVRAEEEAAVLELLDDITSNLWWTRAWTFQEDYRASTRMTLLIPHSAALEERKREARDFAHRPLLGTLQGEICIKSADFRRQATEFCLLYRTKSVAAQPLCNTILQRAGKYNVLLREESSPGPYAISRSMSPTIFADVGSRGITTESDRLAIAANCCGYTTRLDTASLNSSGSSLSLSMLALYLLNGEIIENDPRRCRGTLQDGVFTWLAKQCLGSFRPPVDEELTFIKSCRLLDPVLTLEGTQTRGHLWKLGRTIRREPMRRLKYSTLSPLEILATELNYKKYGASYPGLATSILAWMQDSSAAANKRANKLYHQQQRHRRPWEWREWMANEVEAALLEGKPLRLASMVHPQHEGDDGPCRAIFVCDSEEEQEKEKGSEEDDGSGEDTSDEEASPEESYVFTAARPAKGGRLGDIPKHVSLEVRVEWPTEGGDGAGQNAQPKLYIKRWLNGLCFFDGYPQRPVLFPWPPALLS